MKCWVEFFRKTNFLILPFAFLRMAPANFIPICLCWGALQSCCLTSSTVFRKLKTQHLPRKTLASVARWTSCGTSVNETRTETGTCLHHAPSSPRAMADAFARVLQLCFSVLEPHSHASISESLLVLPPTARAAVEGRTPLCWQCGFRAPGSDAGELLGRDAGNTTAWMIPEWNPSCCFTSAAQQKMFGGKKESAGGSGQVWGCIDRKASLTLQRPHW